MKSQISRLSLLLPTFFIILVWLANNSRSKEAVSVSNGSIAKKESSLSCFAHLQDAKYQNVQWETIDETGTSIKEKKRGIGLTCPRVSWKHIINTTHHDDPSTTCQVDPFDARSFLATFRGRTLVVAGDSLSAHFCRDLQGELTRTGTGTSHAKSSYSSNPSDKGIMHGCQEYEYGVLVCCSWLAFSNAKEERHWANQNLFSVPNDGIALNVLEPYDLMIWNTGVHHTSAFGGTIKDMTRLINKTLSDWDESRALASVQVPTLWWRESYPQHFKNGHWDSWADVKRYKTKKYKNLKRQCYNITTYPLENETGIYNQAAEPIVRSFNDIPILRVYKAAVPLHEHHYRVGTDCTHFCFRDRGPYNHDRGLLAKLINLAIAGGRLPALPRTRSKGNQYYNIQHRWDLLMEHPTDSLMAKLDVCAKPKPPHSWRADTDGLPPPLKKCLQHSKLVHSSRGG